MLVGSHLPLREWVANFLINPPQLCLSNLALLVPTILQDVTLDSNMNNLSEQIGACISKQKHIKVNHFCSKKVMYNKYYNM